MRAFGANGYRLRDARIEIRLIYTGFLLLVLIGMATMAALQCHLIGASPAALAAYYRGGDIGDTMSFGKTFRQLVETTHFHAFIMGVVYLVLAHLVVATPLRAAWKRAMIGLAFAGLLGQRGVFGEIVARQVGKAELVLGRKFPGQVQLDGLGHSLGLGDKLRRGRFFELQEDVGGLDLDPFARIQLDLGGCVGFRQDTAGEEFAGFFKQCVHGGDCPMGGAGRPDAGRASHPL